MGGTCADRRPLRTLFQQLTAGDGEVHGLLVRGREGMGVTTLLEALYRECGSARKAMANLGAAGTPVEVLLQLATQLDLRLFPSFQAALPGMTGLSPTQVRGVVQFGGRMTINVPGPDPEQVTIRHQVLTDLFLTDLEAMLAPGGRVVLLLDGYGSGPDGVGGVDEWIASTLLVAGLHRRWFVLVIGGEGSPPISPAHERWCTDRDLDLFGESDLRELAGLLGLMLEESDIRLIHELTDGFPRDAAASLERVLHKRGPAGA
jgi:hypothetical protein